MIRAAAVAALVVVSLAGCVRMHTTTDVKSDNTVDQEIILAIDVVAFSELGEGASEPPRPDDYLNDIPADVRDRVTVVDYKDGDYEGIRATFTNLTLDELDSGALDSGTEDIGAGGDTTLVREGDEFVLTIFLDNATEEELSEEDEFGDYSSYFDVKVVYSFPGPITSYTAGTVEGNTITFTTAEMYGTEDIVVRADATSASAFPVGLLIAIVVVGLLLIAGVIALVVFLVARSRPEDGAPAAPAAGTVPPPPAPDASAAAPADAPAAPAPEADSAPATQTPPPPPAPPAPPAPPQA